MDKGNGLVTIENKTPLADSRKIAEQLDIDHHNFYAMIKKYEDEVSKDFGIILFETEEIRGRGQPQKYALLTEDQSYVFLAYSQNTESARSCKRLLVKAFAEARAELVQVAPALPEPAISFRYELRLVISTPEEMRKAKAIMAQAELLSKTVNAPTTQEERLQADILYYVNDLSTRFQPPTARDLSRYILYVNREEIEIQADVMATQHKLIKDIAGRSPRYRVI